MEPPIKVSNESNSRSEYACLENNPVFLKFAFDSSIVTATNALVFENELILRQKSSDRLRVTGKGKKISCTAPPADHGKICHTHVITANCTGLGVWQYQNE